jgi:ligand-binding SRPBCC domain-containing protein
MPTIHTELKINAPISRVFDLSRSIDLHVISTHQTKEQAVGGKISGLISLNETVTWRTKHFGIYQNLTSKITEFDRPNSFTDEMIQGAFKHFKHNHSFTEHEGITTMTDTFEYSSPLGWLGILADFLFLKRYMTDLLKRRNDVIKLYAESDKWRTILKT